MIWVLIFVYNGFMQTHSFNTESACIAARDFLKQESKLYEAVCIADKGD